MLWVGGSHFQASVRCPVLVSGNIILIALNALGMDPWTAPELTVWHPPKNTDEILATSAPHFDFTQAVSPADHDEGFQFQVKSCLYRNHSKYKTTVSLGIHWGKSSGVPHSCTCLHHIWICWCYAVLCISLISTACVPFLPRIPWQEVLIYPYNPCISSFTTYEFRALPAAAEAPHSPCPSWRPLTADAHCWSCPGPPVAPSPFFLLGEPPVAAKHSYKKTDK